MKLHLGCGRVDLSKYDFYSIDAIDYPHVNLVHAVDNLPMIADNSVSLIYSAHVLEHFSRREVPKVLAEWFRVLQSGGTLRIAVPDFASAVDLYKTTGKIDLVHGLIFGRMDYLYNFHHSVYDCESLSAVLTAAGFTNIQRYDWKLTEHASVDDYSQAFYPHLQKDTGTLLSLNVEATKP